MWQQNKYMNRAFVAANNALKIDEVPVGAVIVRDKKIIVSCHNRVRSSSDPTAHAEILCIRQTAAILGSTHLGECDIYVTLEPCAMCAQAIAWAKIKRIYFSAYDDKFGAVTSNTAIFHDISANHKPEIYGGIREFKSAQILKKFFQSKR